MKALMTSTKNTITAINAFNDNYIWAITANNCKSVALVDPGDAKVCIDFIKAHQLTLTSILITHHHKDHTGGIEELVSYTKKASNNEVTVYGPANKKISGITKALTENDTVILTELNCSFSVVELPGHTLDHIAYANKATLFCGDTLFSGGCGRLFEGTPEQMYHSLNKLKALDDNTLVYCAHEYTQANLAFAISVDPNNSDLLRYIEHVKELRDKSKASIPSNIGLEKKINPFLRCNIIDVEDPANKNNLPTTLNETKVFTTLRKLKDSF
jgi:hydroxyacylglutathione hydrolase